jgi:PRC-barrel domain
MADLPTEQQFGDYESWPGRAVLHSGGERLGEVREIYLDRDTSQPEWVLVVIDGGDHRFVPLADATIEAETIRVAHDRDTVAAAPDIGADLRIDPDEERRLYDHYGVPHSQERSSTVLPDTEAAAGEPRAAESEAAAGEPAATEAEAATGEPAATEPEPATADAGAAEPGEAAATPVEPSPAITPTPTSAAPQAAAGATDADIPAAARDTAPPSTQDTWTAPPPLPPPAAEPHRRPPVVPIAAGVAAALGAAAAVVIWRRRS